jgi:hypothetical protein
VRLAAGAALAVVAATVAAQAEDRLAGLHTALAAAAWTTIAPGLDRLVVAAPLDLHAFRLAPSAARLRVVPELKPAGSSAVEIADATHAALIINGGFFWITADGNLAPTGWLAAGGKTLAPRKACRACSGAVYADKSGIHIGRERQIKSAHGITDAVQVGPMLVENGAVIRFNPEGPAAARSAVCLDAGHNAIVVAVLSSLTLFELAQLMQAPEKSGGFACETALNLDGGPSSQVVVTVPGAAEKLGTQRPVQNFLAFDLP